MSAKIDKGRTLYIVIIGIYHVTKFPKILVNRHELFFPELLIGFRFQSRITGIESFWFFVEGIGH